MPTLTVAGHSVTVGDDFLKLSPEDQGAMVDHIAQHLPASQPAEPSGVIAGFQHGIAEAARGDASTIGLTGAPTGVLDKVASSTDAPNYKGASLIKEGGHWYNPSDYQPLALPQLLAEQAPGLAQDASAGWAAGKLVPGSPAVKALAGMAGFAGSALLRTFGPGAHANADARTGVPNSPVATQDLTREAAKQAIEAPINMVPGGRLLGTAEKKLAASALAKIGESTAAGFANDAVDQLGTTAGSKDGLSYDPNRGVTSALTRAAGHTLLVAPRSAADAISNRANSGFEADPETRAAAVAVANRNAAAADGQSLVGPLGGTAVAQGVKAKVLPGILRELSASAKGDNLSPDNVNTLANIQGGLPASPKELTALATEASPETVHLARQALISSQVKDTGGLSGALDNLSPIKHPIKTTMGTAAAALAGHAGLGSFTGTIGAIAPAALGALAATYGLARAFDTSFGTRSPMQGFNDRFADPTAPIRTPETPAPVADPATTSVPQVSPPQDTALWGNTAPKPPTPTAQAADIRGMLLMAAARRKSAAAQAQEAPAAPAAPVLGSIAQKMHAISIKPTAADGGVSDAPASPAIGSLMQKLHDSGQLATPTSPPASPAAPPASPQPMPPPGNAQPMSMADVLARAQQATAAPPEAPMIAKISKKRGKPVEETPHAAEESAYTPMSHDQLWGRGMQDKAFAEADAAKLPDLKYPERYQEGIVRDRKLRRNTIGAVLGDETGPDAVHASDLLEELHHTRRADKAYGAIQHFTAKMSPSMRADMRARLGKGFVSSIWSK